MFGEKRENGKSVSHLRGPDRLVRVFERTPEKIPGVSLHRVLIALRRGGRGGKTVRGGVLPEEKRDRSETRQRKIPLRGEGAPPGE